MSAGEFRTCQLSGALGRPGMGMIGPADGVGFFSGLLFKPTAASTLPDPFAMACSASTSFDLMLELVVAVATTFVVFVETVATAMFVLRSSGGRKRTSNMVRRSLRVLSSK